MGPLLKTVLGKAIDVAKEMDVEDWKNLGRMGKDLASNVFTSKNQEIDNGNIKPHIALEAKNITRLRDIEDVDFLDKLKEAGFTSLEIDYYTEFLSCYNEDLTITDSERRLLDKYINKLELSKDRVYIIERIAKGYPIDNNSSSIQRSSPKEITEQELEYIEEYKGCLDDDNEITDGERRLLSKLRDRYGISSERSEILELIALNRYFSSEEKEYYEEIKNCLDEEIDISDNSRRLLEKLRKSLNISEERAYQIEQIVEEDNN